MAPPRSRAHPPELRRPHLDAYAKAPESSNTPETDPEARPTATRDAASKPGTLSTAGVYSRSAFGGACFAVSGVDPVSLAGRSEFVVPAEDAGQRLDRFLVAQFPALSRARIRSLMDEGFVRVDGVPRRASHRVDPGERITVEIPPSPPAGVEPEPIPLDVLYEDSDVAVIDKPAGMVVHPGAGVRTGTLVAALLYRFGVSGLSTIGGPLRPGIVHRLDKDTSGAIVIARTDDAHRKLVEDFQRRSVGKTYVALLHGKIKGESGSVDFPVSRDLRRRSRMTARRREGRAARTDWRVRLRIGPFALVEADLRTGRTHQIRVHFSALGCPVVGDTLYGAPRQERVDSQLLAPLKRNFLHAARIAFDHPRTAKHIEVRAPLPAELCDYLVTLGRAAKGDLSSIDALVREYL